MKGVLLFCFFSFCLFGCMSKLGEVYVESNKKRFTSLFINKKIKPYARGQERDTLILYPDKSFYLKNIDGWTAMISPESGLYSFINDTLKFKFDCEQAYLEKTSDSLLNDSIMIQRYDCEHKHYDILFKFYLYKKGIEIDTQIIAFNEFIKFHYQDYDSIIFYNNSSLFGGEFSFSIFPQANMRYKVYSITNPPPYIYLKRHKSIMRKVNSEGREFSVWCRKQRPLKSRRIIKKKLQKMNLNNIPKALSPAKGHCYNQQTDSVLL